MRAAAAEVLWLLRGSEDGPAGIRTPEPLSAQAIGDVANGVGWAQEP